MLGISRLTRVIESIPSLVSGIDDADSPRDQK